MKKLTLILLIALISLSLAQPKKKVQWNDLQEAVKDSIRNASGGIGDSLDVIRNELGDTIAIYLTAFADDSLTASNGIVYSGRDFGQKIVKNIATLQAYDADSLGTTVYLKEVATGGYGGGQMVYVDSTDLKTRIGSAVVDGVVIFHAPTTDRVWYRTEADNGYLKVEWAGVKLDNSTDNLTAMNSAISSANTLKLTLEGGAGVCVVSDSLLLPRRDFVFRGPQNPISTQHDSTQVFTIRSTNANSPIIHIPGSTGSNLKYVTIENMNLHYSGSGSTAPAIVAGSSPSAYSGDFLFIKNVVIFNTQDAIEARGIGNVIIENVSANNSHDGRYGVKLSGTSIGNASRINFSGSGWDTLYHITASTGGLTILGGDNGDAKRFLHAVGGTQVTVIGANWERCMGGEWVYLSGSYGNFINCRFNQNLGGGGLVRPTFNINGSSLSVMNFFKTQDTVDVVTTTTNNTYFSDRPIRVLFTTTGDIFTVAPTQLIPRAVFESPYAPYRGREVFTFNTGAEQDRKQLHYQGRGGNPKVYETIGPDIFFSLTGASHAFVSAIDILAGGKTFAVANNSSDTTRVKIDVGTWSTPAGFYFAVGSVSQDNVALDSAMAVTFPLDMLDRTGGFVWAVVKHTGLTSGSGCYLSYIIGVRKDD